MDHKNGFLLGAPLSTMKCTVGDLIDFANSLPSEAVCDAAESLAEILKDVGDIRRRRRETVLLGALIHRIVFELQRVPRRRDAEI